MKSLSLSATVKWNFYRNKRAKFHYTEVKQGPVASHSERGGGSPALSHEGKVRRWRSHNKNASLVASSVHSHWRPTLNTTHHPRTAALMNTTDTVSQNWLSCFQAGHCQFSAARDC